MVVDAASHGIIDPGLKADIRPAYQLPLPSPRRPLPSSRRVVPWSLPLEDYVGTSLSSPRVLSNSTRSRAEASAALSSAFSSLISLATVASHTPRSTPRWLCLLAHPRHELSRPSYRGFFKTTRAPDHRILHLSAFSSFLRIYVFIPFFFHFLTSLVSLFCSQHRSIHRDLFYLGILVCRILFCRYIYLSLDFIPMI